MNLLIIYFKTTQILEKRNYLHVKKFTKLNVKIIFTIDFLMFPRNSKVLKKAYLQLNAHVFIFCSPIKSLKTSLLQLVEIFRSPVPSINPGNNCFTVFFANIFVIFSKCNHFSSTPDIFFFGATVVVET